MRKLIFNLHLYGALIAGLFVVVIGVTGSIMAFEDDIDRLTHPGLFHVEPQGAAMPVADLLKAAQKAYPGQRIGSIRFPQRATDAAQFTVKGPRGVFINAYTGAILGERNPVTVLSKIHQLHLRLLMSPSSGKAGGNIVAAATAVLLFLVLSGIYLWWPVKRASINWSANARRIHFDLHNTAGIYSAAFLLVLGITGIVIRFDDDIETYLHQRAGTQKTAKNVPSGIQLNTAPVPASVAAAAGCIAPTATNAKGAFSTPALVGSQTVSGDLGRNAARAFPLQELDFSIHRDFPIREQIRIRFQADMFNVVNHPSFGAMGGTVNATAFGTTTSMANAGLGANSSSGAGFNPIFNTGGPRNFQFALKLFF